MASFFRIIISFSMVSLFVALAFESGIILPSVGFFPTRNSQFVVNGSPFFFNGFNSYWVMSDAAVPSQTSRVSDFFERAAAAGLSVSMSWAFSDAGSQEALQISSDQVYSEHIFQGLDFVISESRKNGVRLILRLGNNIYKDFLRLGNNIYKDFGGRRSGRLSGDDLSYTDEVDKGYFKQHVERLLTRINTITGVAYKDNPTIMAWELISEPPRPVDHRSGETLDGWIQEMVSFIKSIDSNHLLTVGVEGFYGDRNMQLKKMNPAYQVASDFVSIHLFKEIDFTIIHANPDIWLMQSGIDDSLRLYGKEDACLLCKLFETVPFAHTLHLATQSNSAGFVNLLDIAIAYAANPLWESTSSISGLVSGNPFSELHRTSSIHPKDDRTAMAGEPISQPRRQCQVDRTAPLNKRIQERASFVNSIPSKLVTSVGVEGFHGDPNIPEKEAINDQLGKGDGKGMNVKKEKYYKQFPDMHRLGRRLLHTSKESSPTPPAPVDESKASGPVTPSDPSPCTHIPRGDGHC